MTALTEAQTEALASLCARYGTTFDVEAFRPTFDLPPGWVAGWVQTDGAHRRIYVGCSPTGEIAS